MPSAVAWQNFEKYLRHHSSFDNSRTSILLLPMSYQIILAKDLDKDARYQAWLVAQAQVKKQLPPAAFTAIKGWMETPGSKAGDIPHVTFTYIAAFFETGKEADRLKVACADYGYTIDELKALKAAGKTAKDVAAEIVARGMDNS
jgi:hypothetical protein